MEIIDWSRAGEDVLRTIMNYRKEMFELKYKIKEEIKLVHNVLKAQFRFCYNCRDLLDVRLNWTHCKACEHMLSTYYNFLTDLTIFGRFEVIQNLVQKNCTQIRKTHFAGQCMNIIR